MNAKLFIKKVLYWLAPRKCVVFESAPDVSDNSKSVFDEMIKQGINKKYTFVWILHEGNVCSFPQIHNVKYIHQNDAFKLVFYLCTAKCIICCNRCLNKWIPSQYLIYLDHGNPLKNAEKFQKLPQSVDCVLSSGAFFVDLKARILGVDPQKIVTLGFPRNDTFYETPVDIRKIILRQYDKLIAWYPTFRQHKNGHRNDSSVVLPILHDEESVLKLDEVLCKYNVVLIMKPHFAQDVSRFKELKLNNFIIINDSFLSENNLTSYQFLNSTDALLSDYSSVYYDYTLKDKPIGLVWEDIEEYKNKLGLIENYESICEGAEIIYDIDDLCGFVKRVASGDDILADKRREIRDITNYRNDGENSKRVVEYIRQKCKL